MLDYINTVIIARPLMQTIKHAAEIAAPISVNKYMIFQTSGLYFFHDKRVQQQYLLKKLSDVERFTIYSNI